jgi:5-methylcytosine-specific restriction endonuclease McrA
VLARDGFRCRDCGRTENEPGVELHLDHVIPVSRGGPTTEDNLITACNRCNLGKSNREILPNRDGWPQAAPEPGSGLDDSSPGIG